MASAYILFRPDHTSIGYTSITPHMEDKHMELDSLTLQIKYQIPLQSISQGLDVLNTLENGKRYKNYENEDTNSEGKRFDETFLMMKEASVYMGDTLNSILNMHKIQQGKLVLTYTPVVIKDMINKVQYACRKLLKDKDIHLVMCIDEDVAYSVMGDSFQIEFVLSHLLIHVIQFSSSTEGSSISINISKVNEEKKLNVFHIKKNVKNSKNGFSRGSIILGTNYKKESRTIVHNYYNTNTKNGDVNVMYVRFAISSRSRNKEEVEVGAGENGCGCGCGGRSGSGLSLSPIRDGDEVGDRELHGCSGVNNHLSVCRYIIELHGGTMSVRSGIKTVQGAREGSDNNNINYNTTSTVDGTTSAKKEGKSSHVMLSGTSMKDIDSIPRDMMCNVEDFDFDDVSPQLSHHDHVEVDDEGSEKYLNDKQEVSSGQKTAIKLKQIFKEGQHPHCASAKQELTPDVKRVLYLTHSHCSDIYNISVRRMCELIFADCGTGSDGGGEAFVWAGLVLGAGQMKCSRSSEWKGGTAGGAMLRQMFGRSRRRAYESSGFETLLVIAVKAIDGVWDVGGVFKKNCCIESIEVGAGDVREVRGVVLWPIYYWSFPVASAHQYRSNRTEKRSGNKRLGCSNLNSSPKFRKVASGVFAPRLPLRSRNYFLWQFNSAMFSTATNLPTAAATHCASGNGPKDQDTFKVTQGSQSALTINPHDFVWPLKILTTLRIKTNQRPSVIVAKQTPNKHHNERKPATYNHHKTQQQSVPTPTLG
eukprot:gene6493-13104_t